MIIGINGKINSGKDLTGKIIQILISNTKVKPDFTINDVLNNEYGLFPYSGWQIKKFADKLKDIVCLLLNCTRQQLEDREFKEKELGEEWWFNHILPEHGFGTKLVNWDGKLTPQKMTPRLLLQLLGTECGRNIIHPNIWVNVLMSEYISKSVQVGTTPENLKWEDEYPNWIITDLRFPNELEAIKNRDGISIKIKRHISIPAVGYSPDGPVIVEHESETALNNHTFDYTIFNNGTIEQLIDSVKEILILEKII